MAINRSPRRVSQTEKRRARQGRRQNKGRLKAVLAMMGMGVLAVLIIAGLALPSFGGGGGGQNISSESLADRPTGDEAPGNPFDDQGRVHLEVGERNPEGYYNSNPPTSGAHAPSWVDCGIHAEPILDEFQVHNLEHGFVIIQYNTEDETMVSNIKEVAEGLDQWPHYYILAPYPELENTIALTAWGIAQYMDTVDVSTIETFAKAYRGRGPEANTPSCGAGGFMESSG